MSGVFRLPTLKNVLDAYSGDIESEVIAELGGGIATEGGLIFDREPLPSGRPDWSHEVGATRAHDRGALS